AARRGDRHAAPRDLHFGLRPVHDAARMEAGGLGMGLRLGVDVLGRRGEASGLSPASKKAGLKLSRREALDADLESAVAGDVELRVAAGGERPLYKVQHAALVAEDHDSRGGAELVFDLRAFESRQVVAPDAGVIRVQSPVAPMQVGA